MTWERATLGSLGAQAQTGFASGKHTGDGEVLHLRPMNITPLGTLTFDGSKYVDAQAGIQRVQHGDILFNNTNSPKWVGKTTWIGTVEALAFSNHMTRLRVPGHQIYSKFLAIYLHYQQSAGHFESICSNHVNQASVSRKRLLETEVPVPPLEEQRRIVAILESHLSRLDAAETYLGEALRWIDTLRTVTRGKLHEGPTATLASLSTGASYGTSSKCVVDGLGPAVVRIPNLVDGTINLTDEKRVADAKVDVSKSMLTKGDLLIVRTNGSVDLIGRSAVSPAGLNAAFASYLIRYQLRRDQVRPEWVHTMLSTPQLRMKIEELAASSAGQHNLSLGKLGSLVIPLPTLAEQDRLLGIVSSMDADRQRLMDAVATARVRSKALRRSLLAAAFSGRLTGSSTETSAVGEMIVA